MLIIIIFNLTKSSKTANKILNGVERINRGTYDFTSKPSGTIEWE